MHGLSPLRIWEKQADMRAAAIRGVNLISVHWSNLPCYYALEPQVCTTVLRAMCDCDPACFISVRLFNVYCFLSEHNCAIRAKQD